MWTLGLLDQDQHQVLQAHLVEPLHLHLYLALLYQDLHKGFQPAFLLLVLLIRFGIKTKPAIYIIHLGYFFGIYNSILISSVVLLSTFTFSYAPLSCLFLMKVNLTSTLDSFLLLSWTIFGIKYLFLPF